jgi:hypothetical protein
MYSSGFPSISGYTSNKPTEHFPRAPEFLPSLTRGASADDISFEALSFLGRDAVNTGRFSIAGRVLSVSVERCAWALRPAELAVATDLRHVGGDAGVYPNLERLGRGYRSRSSARFWRATVAGSAECFLALWS